MASRTQTIQVLKLWCLQAEDRKAVEIFHKKLKNLRRHRRRKIMVMTLMVLANEKCYNSCVKKYMDKNKVKIYRLTANMFCPFTCRSSYWWDNIVMGGFGPDD